MSVHENETISETTYTERIHDGVLEIHIIMPLEDRPLTKEEVKGHEHYKWQVFANYIMLDPSTMKDRLSLGADKQSCTCDDCLFCRRAGRPVLDETGISARTCHLGPGITETEWVYALDLITEMKGEKWIQELIERTKEVEQ